MNLTPQDFAAATQVIRDNQRILITPHANVDPDGLGSALACYMILTALGKDVTVICPDTLPESLNFLPGFENLTQEVDKQENFIITVNLQEGVEVDKLRYTVEDQKVNIIVIPKSGQIDAKNITFGEGGKPHDLLLVVDTADLPLLGSLYTDNVDLFTSVPILNVDHHISNTQYGQVQLIDPTAASATEVLYDWFMQEPIFKEHITPDVATLLLTGLITDTRSFQNPNTTPRSLEVAAELLEYGARQQEIIQNIYKTKPLSTLQIWGRALNRLQIDRESGLVWSAISKEDLAEMAATSKESHGLLDELISTIPDADVHVLFTELEEGGIKASMRSSPAINVSKLAQEAYGGGGHARAAGFKVFDFENFELQVLECVQKLKDGMLRQRQGDMAAPLSATETTETQDILPAEPEVEATTTEPAAVSDAPEVAPDTTEVQLEAPSDAPEEASAVTEESEPVAPLFSAESTVADPSFGVEPPVDVVEQFETPDQTAPEEGEGTDVVDGLTA